MKHLALNRQPASDINRVRKLPLPGQVLVEVGQSVHPEDLIAEAELPGEIYSMDIARGLGVDTSEVLNYLVRDLGEQLAQDDVLAEYIGAFPRLMRVPRAGKLLTCRDGVAFIASGKKLLQIRAGMIGMVSEILPEWGAVITTQGDLIQGVWGNGRVGAGILRTQSADLDKALTSSDLKKFNMGQVIAAGFCSDGAVVENITEIKPTGLILGWIESRLIEPMLALPFPVILLQGFGPCPPDLRTFDMLQERNGDVVCINAIQPDRMMGEWPEVILPKVLDERKPPQPFRNELRIGLHVQVLAGPAKGGIFKVGDLPEDKITLESGLTCKVAVLESDRSEPLTVPRDNVIIVGALDT